MESIRQRICRHRPRLYCLLSQGFWKHFPVHGLRHFLVPQEQCQLKSWKSLKAIYTKHQRQHCDDACDSALIENNRVAPEWVCNPFSSNSTVFNEDRITSVIAALTLMLDVNGPLPEPLPKHCLRDPFPAVFKAHSHWYFSLFFDLFRFRRGSKHF